MPADAALTCVRFLSNPALDSRTRINVCQPFCCGTSPSAMGVRMQTSLIQSRGIEALHYNADARLLLIKYSSCALAASPAFRAGHAAASRRRLQIADGPRLSGVEYQAEIRK